MGGGLGGDEVWVGRLDGSWMRIGEKRVVRGGGKRGKWGNGRFG